MEDLVRSLQDIVDAKMAQLRAEHVNETRLLTEHYHRHIRSIEADSAAIQQAREQEVEQAEEDYLELEETNEELEQQVEQLEQEQQESSERIEVLEQENQDLETEKEDWETEKADLEVKNADLKRQARIWKRQYQKVFAEKVALQRQYGPPPRLTIELMAAVASFVAGSNAYGTLSALCRTSQLMFQECTPYLYETVTWTPALHLRLRHCKRHYPTSWQHIKHIVTEYGHWKDLPLSEKTFPNLRAIIVKQATVNSRWINQTQSLSNFSVQLDIRKCVTSSTLNAIFKGPLIWTFASNVRVRSRVRSITSIVLHKQGYLLPGNPLRNASFVPMQEGHGPAIIRIKHAASTEETQLSIQELCRYLSFNRSNIGAPHNSRIADRLCIMMTSQANIQWWARELPNTLRVRPNLNLTLKITEEMETQHVLQHFTNFAQIYEGMCSSPTTGRATLPPSGTRFFVLEDESRTKSSLPSHRISFTTAPLMTQFRAVAERYTIRNGQRVRFAIYDETLPGPLLRNESSANDLMYVDVERDSDNEDSDDSALTELSSEA